MRFLKRIVQWIFINLIELFLTLLYARITTRAAAEILERAEIQVKACFVGVLC